MYPTIGTQNNLTMYVIMFRDRDSLDTTAYNRNALARAKRRLIRLSVVSSACSRGQMLQHTAGAIRVFLRPV